MSIENVRAAIATAFSAGSFFASDKIGWENMDFRPPAGSAWAAFHFVPTQPEVYTLGESGRDQMDGFVQIDLSFPLNAGPAAALQKADSIRQTFKAGSKFQSGGQTVVVRSCGHNQGRILENCYRIEVTIFFYAHITRAT